MFLGPLVGVMFPKLVLQRAQEIMMKRAMHWSDRLGCDPPGGRLDRRFLSSMCVLWGLIWQAVQSMESHPVVGPSFSVC